MLIVIRLTLELSLACLHLWNVCLRYGLDVAFFLDAHAYLTPRLYILSVTGDRSNLV